MKNSEFQFKNPRLEKLDFEINENYTEDNEFKSSISVANKIIGENNAMVKLDIEIGDRKEFLFFINLVIAAEFHWEDMDEKQRDKFLSINAPALLLSYARPIISNVTLQAGFRPLNLPFINFTRKDD